jgi:hypothetical protein
MKKETRTTDPSPKDSDASVRRNLTWLRASYRFHTFAYRDPRSAFSAGQGLPLVSPTAALLGIASTLFNLGRPKDALDLLKVIHTCEVVIDPPDGVIFFRAFHQLRRYVTSQQKKKGQGVSARVGLTAINQGTREYGLVQGLMTFFVGVPRELVEPVKLALRNRDHVGTHDSLCSLDGEVTECSEPEEVVYLPPEVWQRQIPQVGDICTLMLSRFRQEVRPAVGKHWWMAGGAETELVPYLIKGRFTGTSRGKVYRKNPTGNLRGA